MQPELQEAVALLGQMLAVMDRATQELQAMRARLERLVRMAELELPDRQEG